MSGELPAEQREASPAERTCLREQLSVGPEPRQVPWGQGGHSQFLPQGPLSSLESGGRIFLGISLLAARFQELWAGAIIVFKILF